MTRPCLAALLGGLLLSLAPCATAQTDYSDLWWNPAESGWGVGIQRQGDVLFLTLFVYGPDGSNTWLVAPDVRRTSEADTRWSGALYRTTGPAYSATFAGPVQASSAGSASLEFSGPASATLRYTVDGAAVTKSITRMTWREPSAAGSYHGGFSSIVRACADPTRVGAYDFLGAMNVTQAERQMTAVFSTGSTGGQSQCTFTGTLAYAGRLADWTGTFTCSIYLGLDGRGENPVTAQRRGSFSVRELAISANGVYGALSATDQDCAFTGYFGATRVP